MVIFCTRKKMLSSECLWIYIFWAIKHGYFLLFPKVLLFEVQYLISTWKVPRSELSIIPFWMENWSQSSHITLFFGTDNFLKCHLIFLYLFFKIIIVFWMFESWGLPIRHSENFNSVLTLLVSLFFVLFLFFIWFFNTLRWSDVSASCSSHFSRETGSSFPAVSFLFWKGATPKGKNLLPLGGKQVTISRVEYVCTPIWWCRKFTKSSLSQLDIYRKFGKWWSIQDASLHKGRGDCF